VIFSGFKDALIRMADALKAALFPGKCLVCRSFFQPGTEHGGRLFKKGFADESFFGLPKKVLFERLTAPFLCLSCRIGFTPVEPPFCSDCGILFKSREGEDHVCGTCRLSPKRFGIARASGVYDGSLMAMIHLLKYRGKIQLARPLGALLLCALRDFWDEKDLDLVVPVPLHTRRFRTRGFNQAFLLIRDWGVLSSDPTKKSPCVQIDRQLLVRSKWTEPQTGMDRKRRIANIRGAFSISDASTIKGKRILLVDDVYTTGATADECSKVLLAGGAGRVDVLTLARAM
jgi:ComF family protein